jgi:hypothetical protein
LQLFTYATKDWQRQSFGSLLASYVRYFIEALEKYTDSGKDRDAVSCFGRAVERYRIVIEADPMVPYCGFDITEGTLRILFHPDNLAYNTQDLSHDHYLAQIVDSWESPFPLVFRRLILASTGIAARDPGFLPLALARAAKTVLEPKLERHREELRSIFGKSVDISYDLRALFNILTERASMERMESRHFRQEGNLSRGIPGEIHNYLDSAILKLKSLDFRHDELYRSEWLAAAPKGVVFEVVEQLQTVIIFPKSAPSCSNVLLQNASYNECIYKDGFFRLRTIPYYFGTHYATIADRAIDQL